MAEFILFSLAGGALALVVLRASYP